MPRRFIVAFKDSELINFYDIISLDDNQIRDIKKIASEYTKGELRKKEEYGFDLPYLTVKQKQRIIESKNRVVYGKEPDILLKEKKVLFSSHSLNRLLEREGSNSTQKLLNIIKFIIEADSVLKAQFKGYSSLTYTLTHGKDSETYKLPISFKWSRGSRQILSVTFVSKSAATHVMTRRLVGDKDLEDKMNKFKQELINRSKNNKGHN